MPHDPHFHDCANVIAGKPFSVLRYTKRIGIQKWDARRICSTETGCATSFVSRMRVFRSI